MQYRDFGKTGWKVSALGFGAMRLPTVGDQPMTKRIREAEAIGMIRHAIDRGVNYVDTAYGYHEKKGEVIVGKALRGGYRDRVRIATKSPVWLIEKKTDFDRLLATQLRRLRTDHIDFYLFHALNGDAWEKTVLKHGLLKRAEKAIADGRIGGIGFSFHDDLKAFKKIVDGYDGWALAQIQYNYLDTQNQAGTKGLRYAASKGIPVVVMEPLLGGRLANPPRQIRDALRLRGRRVVPFELALKWVWDQPEVATVLSGMSTMNQVRGNLRAAGRSGVGELRAGERRLIERVTKMYRSMAVIPCTKCNYCMPCPHGIAIPTNFEEYNDAYVHNDLGNARRTYERFFNPKKRASACKHCRECEKKCPQKLPISSLMAEVHRVLGEGKPFDPGVMRRKS
ncbi:MAG: aldo/keto reductase [Candidatus Thermoplasmatota archaeon]